MVKKVNHVGIVVQDFDRVIETFKGFGLPCSEIREVQKLASRIAFFPVGETVLEVICQAGPAVVDDPMVRVVARQEGTINHIGFEVDDMNASVQEFEKHGARLIEGCPRNGPHGPIAFFRPETTEGILIELCQPKNDKESL
jgi:methylmalonyl-CoA epimerase